MSVLSLRVTARAIKELGMVYRNPLDALRELIQNAMDAGATRIDIRLDRENGTLVFEHNGKPIEGEYLDAFLTVGTDFKARQGGYIGFYGIGRLSWLMLGSEAVIETGSKRLIWREETIDRIEVEDLPERFEGVRWIIKLRKDVAERLSEYDITAYVQGNYFGSVPVYVNGKKVETLLKDAVLLYQDDFNKVYFTSRSSYSGYIVKNVFAIDREYELPKLIVFTNDPRVKMNPARGLVYDYDYRNWLAYIARAVLAIIQDRYREKPHEAAKVFGVETLSDYINAAYRSRYLSTIEPEKAREMISFLPFETAEGTWIWGSKLDPNSWLYSLTKVTDTTRVSLKKKGYRIVYVPNETVAKWFEAAGFKSVEEIAVVEEAKVITTGVERKLAEVFNEVKNVVDEVISGVGAVTRPRAEVSLKVPSATGGAEIEVSQYADGIEIKIVNRSSEIKPVINRVFAKIVGAIKDLNIYFVEMPNEDVVAFYANGRIFLNVRNRDVAERLAKTKRIRNIWKLTLMWAPIVLHEMLHARGLDHTDPEWHRVYEMSISRIIDRAVEHMK